MSVLLRVSKKRNNLKTSKDISTKRREVEFYVLSLVKPCYEVLNILGADILKVVLLKLFGDYLSVDVKLAHVFSSSSIYDFIIPFTKPGGQS